MHFLKQIWTRFTNSSLYQGAPGNNWKRIHQLHQNKKSSFCWSLPASLKCLSPCQWTYSWLLFFGCFLRGWGGSVEKKASDYSFMLFLVPPPPTPHPPTWHFGAILHSILISQHIIGTILSAILPHQIMWSAAYLVRCIIQQLAGGMFQ